MRRLILFLSCLTLASTASVFDTNIHFGKTIPLHIPTQTLTVNETFEVPSWLGAFYATVEVGSTWTLPLTIGNGGQTYPGEFLIVRNNGPADITLLPSAPETINNVSSYLVQAGTTTEILSGYPNWVIVSSSTNTQPTQYIYTFYDPSTVQFTVEIVPDPPTIPAAEGNVGWNTVSIGPLAGTNATGTGSNNNIGPRTGLNSAGRGCNNFGPYAGEGSTGSTNNNIGWLAGYYSTGTDINNIGREAGRNSVATSYVNNMGYQAGLFSSGAHSSHNGYRAGLNNTFDYCYTNGRTSACTATNQFVFGSGGFPLHLRLPSDVGSYCTGAAYDTCLNRAAANSWTFNAGTSLRVPQYFSVGAATAPSNTATGAITTTKATPTLQAFGAVTANAASGVLAFTVSTAAATCTSAIVTNSNVIAGSEVILTIQKYTGVQFTNGRPSVSREDTAGSSIGNFNLQICNDHATNALSGNLYVAFWVLN